MGCVSSSDRVRSSVCSSWAAGHRGGEPQGLAVYARPGRTVTYVKSEASVRSGSVFFVQLIDSDGASPSRGYLQVMADRLSLRPVGAGELSVSSQVTEWQLSSDLLCGFTDDGHFALQYIRKTPAGQLRLVKFVCSHSGDLYLEVSRRLQELHAAVAAAVAEPAVHQVTAEVATSRQQQYPCPAAAASASPWRVNVPAKTPAPVSASCSAGSAAAGTRPIAVVLEPVLQAPREHSAGPAEVLQPAGSEPTNVEDAKHDHVYVNNLFPLSESGYVNLVGVQAARQHVSQDLPPSEGSASSPNESRGENVGLSEQDYSEALALAAAQWPAMQLKSSCTAHEYVNFASGGSGWMLDEVAVQCPVGGPVEQSFSPTARSPTRASRLLGKSPSSKHIPVPAPRTSQGQQCRLLPGHHSELLQQVPLDARLPGPSGTSGTVAGSNTRLQYAQLDLRALSAGAPSGTVLSAASNSAAGHNQSRGCEKIACQPRTGGEYSGIDVEKTLALAALKRYVYAAQSALSAETRAC